MKPEERTCECPAYKFPHREGGGFCHVGIEPVCAACGRVCQPIDIDVGIGPVEYFGARSFDREIVEASDCCGSDIL
jgi:hypothetical protein